MGITQRVEMARGKRENFQRKMLSSSSCLWSKRVEDELLHEYISISSAEEAFFKQKSRNKWLNLGDNNSSYFHCLIKTRQERNTIKCLLDGDGNQVEEVDQIKDLVVDFYQKLLGSSNDVEEAAMIQTVSSLFQDQIPEDTKSFMQREVTKTEIKKSFILHGKRESTWTDGFTVEFFNHAWHIVKSDFVAAIASFFRSSKLLTEVNSTLITLVLKIPNPSTVADFRPIACCNVVYKCITKVLANRLQACLNFLVNSNQTAFIKGRNISENVLLAHELIKTITKILV